MARYAQSVRRQPALSDLVAAEGSEIYARFGPALGWDQLLNLLRDRAFVRFPCELRFNADPLLPGEFAHAARKGQKPEDGYTIFIHPVYEQQLQWVPYLVLHQLVLINHGDTATADDAETFGSRALGLSKDEYYRALCELSGQIGGDDLI